MWRSTIAVAVIGKIQRSSSGGGRVITRGGSTLQVAVVVETVVAEIGPRGRFVFARRRR